MVCQNLIVGTVTVDHFAQAEVDQLYGRLPVLAHVQDVLRLDVAVDDACQLV
jgi:hypothetical protein